ncbi:MAG: LamG domain-containing protein [Woeseiaceae bacterium]|nr:LamG domain-containing protein [Woeseiaceae bacterium]
MTNAKSVLLVVLAGFVLAACGGGASTTDLPPPQNGGGNTGSNPYTGPVARDDDVLKFQQEFWSNARGTDRCGGCHNESVGQSPMFVRNDDVNMAYDTAIALVDTGQPALSQVVTKVQTGHNCWVTDPNVCAAIMTTWIENWTGDGAGGGRQIVLTPPISSDPGSSRNFPADPFGPPSFESILHQPILTTYCQDCHSSEAATPIQPYFADPDVNVAYDAAKSKINLDDPAASRFVVRLAAEFHNCWSASCTSDSVVMENAITTYANLITPTQVDPNLVFSKAVRLTDGIIASGGNRFEDAQIALWEFKTGSGLIAYDTSGVDPAIDLNFSGDVEWYGGWGITINDGKAQGSTTASRKLFDILQESGEFSIEAWVVPGNVTQEMARIVSYSAGNTARNFTLQQTLYNYDFLLRTNETSLNGDPALSTPDADEVLQSTLQHVVATYDPIEGRKIYVNGNLVTQTDPVPGGTLIDWQDTFALVLGNEASGDGLWMGTIRLAAIHRRALTQEQVTQNFDVGVGEKFYLLFDISEILQAAPQSSYVLYEVAQFDTYAYLFDKPHFITLDGSTPEGIPMQGLRIAMNGQEAPVGQSYANLDQTLSASLFEELGQPLSGLGAVLPLEKGPDDDEFFLTFDRLAAASYSRPEDPALVITETDLVPVSQVGVRTFDEINATFAAVTGVDPTTPAVDMTYQELRQSLPAVEDVTTFLSSHQVAIAQLAIEYCNALVESPGAASYFPGLNLNGNPATVLAGGPSPAPRDLLVDPLIENIVGNARTGPVLGTQPTFATVYTELASFSAAGGRPDNLIDRLIAGGSDTRSIAKGVCAATLGSGVTLVQ